MAMNFKWFLLIYWIMNVLTLQAKMTSESGVLNAVHWDTLENPQIPLNGKWQFYWNQYLYPNQYPFSVAEDAMLNVPSSWDTLQTKSKFPPNRYGYGTLVLRVKLPFNDNKNSNQYYLDLVRASLANEIDIIDVQGNKLIDTAKSGIIGDNKDSYRGLYSPIRICFNASSDIVIIWRLCNFEFPQGGPLSAPQLGYGSKYLIKRQFIEWLDFISFGFVIIAGIYHLFLFILIPQRKSLVWFAVFSIFLGGRFLVAKSYIEDIFPNEYIWFIYHRFEYLALMISPSASVIFLSETFPNIIPEKIKKWILWIPFACIPIVLFFPASIYRMLLPVVQAFVLFTVSSWMYILIISIVKNNRRKNALILLTGALLLSLMATYDVMMVSSFRRTGTVQYGLAFFILFQSIVLSLDYQKMMNSTQKQFRQKEHAYLQMKKLLYPHQITQIHAGKTLEKTMPIGETKACCLSFNVIDAQKYLTNPDYSEQLNKFFFRVNRFIFQDYNMESLQSVGYRLKLTGNGMLITVGFPFACPKGWDVYSLSLFIANHLVEMFLLEFNHKNSELKNNITCSIGIAYGNMVGVIPKKGIKNYDLYGQAIVLATRYEQLSTAILNRLKQESKPIGNIIIMQRDVFDRLALDARNSFRRVLLQKEKVRDDESSKQLFIKLVDTQGDNIEAGGSNEYLVI